MNRLSSPRPHGGSASVLLLVVAAWWMAAGTAAPAQEPRSSPEALGLYQDAATLQNAGEFALAAEEWQKFLDRHADDPLAPKAQHYLGVCLSQQKKLPQAIAAFQQVIEKYPKFELREDAYLNLGLSQFAEAQQKNDSRLYALAARNMSELVKEFPNSKYADQAYYYWGESLYALDNKEGSLAAYQRVVSDFEDSPLRADALYALGATREELEKYAEAGPVYDTFLAEFPDHRLATEVRMRKAETLMQTGKPAEAEAIFAAVAAVEGFPQADHALFRQATCALRQEKFAEAGALFAQVVEKYPDSLYAKESPMIAGRCFYRAQEFDKAAVWFDRVIAADGDEAPEAAHWRARIHLRDGKPAEAAALVEKILPKAQGSAWLVSLLMDQGDALYEIPERREQALALFVKVAAEHADSDSAPQALYNAAYGALELKKFDEALKHADAFLQKHAGHALTPDVQYVAAESNLQLGRYAEAERLFGELTAADQNRPEQELWRLRRGLTLFLSRKYPQTVEALSGVVGEFKQPSQQAHAWFLIGASQFLLGKNEEAVAALEKSLAAAPKWEQADETWLYLSRAQRRLNQFDAARASVRRVIDEFPESRLLDRAYFHLGEYSYAAGDHAAAVAAYGEVINRWPDSAVAPHSHYGKGWALLRQGKHAEAADAFTAVIEGKQDERLLPLSYSARAVCRQQTGDFQGGIADVAEYLKSDPGPAEKADALYVRGLCEVGLKDDAAAAKTFEALLAESPEYKFADKVLYQLGWAYKTLGKDAESVKYFERLVADHPQSSLAAEGHYHLGERLYEEKKYAVAVAAYQAALEKADRGELAEKAAYKLGWAHYQLEQFGPALAAFSKQVADYPEGKLAADGVFMKAECLFKLERFEEALPVYVQATQMPASTKEIEVLTLLRGGQSAAQVKQWQQSVDLLKQITENHADSPFLAEALYEQGWAKQNLNQWDEAIALFERAAEQSRTEVGARARFMIGELYFAKKDYDEAVKQFVRVMFGYGGDAAPPEIKRWQAKSGYEAARATEVQIKDAQGAARTQRINDARRYFTYVVEKHPDSEEAPLAQRRLAELAKL